MARAVNFNAGPAALPLAALERAARELADVEGTGMSIMEHSHRGKTYEAIHNQAIALTRELLGLDLSKQQQSSDWGAETLTDAQIAYAAADVLHLHALKERLDAMLVRESRAELAAACFGFLPVRARLDLAGFAEEDIFAHS